MRNALILFAIIIGVLTFAVGMSELITYPNSLIFGTIKDKKLVSEVLNDSIISIDTANWNDDYTRKFIDSRNAVNTNELRKLKEINQFLDCQTNKYRIIILHQNFKKFEREEATALYIIDLHGKFISQNTISESLKEKILDKVWSFYQRKYMKKNTDTIPTNIKMK